MMPRRLKTVISALTLLLLLFANSYAQEKAGDLKIGPYVFESAGAIKTEAELGRLFVPENRARPGSRLIELAFIRFKSTSKTPGAPIVYLAGGPGGSGIGAARGNRFPLFMALREVADVIALDQRGTGMSRPNLTCTEALDHPIGKTPERDAVIELFKTRSRACAARLTGQGVDLAGYNTNESADDIEDLRKALGVPKISLWAISYGTHLSFATIKRHEKSIDRAILAGVEGPGHTIKLPSNIQNHLEHIDRLVKADPVLSKDIPSFLTLVREVLDRVEREPVVVETINPATNEKVKITINRFVLQLLTAFAFGTGENALPRAFYQMSKGDFSQAAQRWLAFVRPGQSIGSAMAFMMDCYSGVSPDRRRQVEREAKTTLLGNILDLPFPDVCPAWGSPDAGAAFRAPVKTSLPTLFISGTFDVRTPPGNAEEVRRGFTNSEHLVIDGAVHSDPLFLSSPKIREVMLEFLRGQKISTRAIKLEPLKFL